MKDPASMTLPRAPEVSHSPSVAVVALLAMSRSPTPFARVDVVTIGKLPDARANHLACGTVHALLVSLPPLLLLADVCWLGNEDGERSLVKFAQSALLGDCAYKGRIE